jgi:hypothetical protein
MVRIGGVRLVNFVKVEELGIASLDGFLIRLKFLRALVLLCRWLVAKPKLMPNLQLEVEVEVKLKLSVKVNLKMKSEKSLRVNQNGLKVKVKRRKTKAILERMEK